MLVTGEGLELNETTQLLVYADNVVLLGDDVNTIKRNAGILIVKSKEIGLEVNVEKTKYIITSRYQNGKREGDKELNANEKIPKRVDKFNTIKYLGTILNSTNQIRDEIKKGLQAGNPCFYSVNKLLASRLLLRNLKVKIVASGCGRGDATDVS